MIDLDAALLELTDSQLNAALVRRAQAQAARRREQAAARQQKVRDAKAVRHAVVTQNVTPESRDSTEARHAIRHAVVTQNEAASPSPSVSSPSPPPSTPPPAPTHTRARAVFGTFERFWEAYPQKVGKLAAQRAFEIKNLGSQIDAVLRAIEAQKRSQKWIEGYIPNPLTWINQGRWEDEVRAAGPRPANGHHRPAAASKFAAEAALHAAVDQEMGF